MGILDKAKSAANKAKDTAEKVKVLAETKFEEAADARAEKRQLQESLAAVDATGRQDEVRSELTRYLQKTDLDRLAQKIDMELIVADSGIDNYNNALKDKPFQEGPVFDHNKSFMTAVALRHLSTARHTAEVIQRLLEEVEDEMRRMNERLTETQRSIATDLQKQLVGATVPEERAAALSNEWASRAGSLSLPNLAGFKGFLEDKISRLTAAADLIESGSEEQVEPVGSVPRTSTSGQPILSDNAKKLWMVAGAVSVLDR